MKESYQGKINYSNELIENFMYYLMLFFDTKYKFKEDLTKQKKNIVYFGENDEGIEYDVINPNKKYKEANKDNIYYYDQCHTVGSDLKQSYNGHIVVIINRKTRYTDFAQAIFRFRKLNRGTYLNVFFIADDKPFPKTNDEIYEILNVNEREFNEGQHNGLKYQLLKAMLRKESKQYQETDLLPEFMKEIKFDKKLTIDMRNKFNRYYIKQNIKYSNNNQKGTSRIQYSNNTTKNKSIFSILSINWSKL
jgi:hypothetical protein